MIEVNWSRARLKPYDHQREGVRALLGVDTRGRKEPNVLALFDDVGAGKTKQTIDSAHALYEHEAIDTMLVGLPSFARGVWANPDPVMGEIAKHAWADTNNVVQTFDVDSSGTLDFSERGLHWVVTNYEFFRRTEHLTELLKMLRGRRIWLALDEAWAIKSHKSKTAKACRKLRAVSSRATLLNGTPIARDYLDLFSQMTTLSPRILFPTIQPKTITQGFSWFTGRYAIKGGEYNQIVGWQNIDELNALVAPYILRRETRECIDLPPILPPITLYVPLKPETWRLYVQMRDELVAWLDTDGSRQASVASHTIVKGLRLAQICAGFLGGIQSLDEQADLFDPELTHQVGQVGSTAPREIGREKLDFLSEWLQGNESDKTIIWCKFRAELDRAARGLAESHPRVLRIWGQQDPESREAAVRSLAPGGDPEPALVVGNASAGGAALNLAAANLMIFMSNDFNYRVRRQAEGRIDRPGQTRSIQYVDVVATGPKGQKTVDHLALSVLRNREDVSQWSARQWRERLREE